ncbi:MAG: uracil-DNA glycosylase [Candidatus Woesearchaeota archaeon]
MDFNVENSWKDLLKQEFKKEYFKKLSSFVDNEYKNKTIYPPKDELFKAFELTPFEEVKVVIIGQDPYYKKGQANGLAFSVNQHCEVPKSLKNIYKEIKSNNPNFNKQTGDLKGWAKQGVLMINTVLTVEDGKPNSHQDKGWEIFTKNVIKLINDKKENVIFILWGKNSKDFEKYLNTEKHYILKSSHPSPLAAYRSFFGSKHFKRINEILKTKNKKQIDWSR